MDSSEIKATLRYGRFVQGWRVKLLYIAIAVCSLMPISTIVMLISVFLNAFSWESEMLFGVLFGNAFCILIGVVCIVSLQRHNKVKKEVEKWLTDAVLLKAEITRMDIVDRTYKPYQIKVEFYYNGKKFIHTSNPGNFFTGYRKIFLNFTGKTRVIVYSPEFDQVLFK